MSLTPRQILILLVLIAGFGIAAFVVSRGEGEVSEVDQALWCNEARVLEGTGPLFRGEIDDATAEEIETLKVALFDVETIAPFDLWAHIARLADFAIIAGQQRAELDWPDAYAAARENKETVLDEAIGALDAELTTCGIQLG